jgi:hypothetical protein
MPRACSASVTLECSGPQVLNRLTVDAFAVILSLPFFLAGTCETLGGVGLFVTAPAARKITQL